MDSFRSTAVLAPARLARGFTLIEMLVVLAIIVVISGIVFSGESNFNRSFFITNTAYDIALSVRQAQSYGLSSQNFAGTLNPGYGIYISTAIPNSYTLFSDIYPTASSNAGGKPTPATRPGNGLYDTGESVQQYSLGNGLTIASFCATSLANVTTCYASGASPTRTLNILFSRPNSDVNIQTVAGGSSTKAQRACFVISDSAGDKRYVNVSQVGQVSVVASCP